ncbi:DegT/DnrJ/EryC1/StrS family aminotransferase [Bacillus cereus]|uniref:DegT/DnrJ/EryC1/StrS family aminotransferase n=1 Tax=Bacillus cereus TaxID=1396 RepID=UPI00065D704D|nr:DegT/DnrJ/EryC1/StrS family aminotransferase [Bacillus cereus]KMQ32168.1 hypothetical protein TU58_01390 [Bacillus cereus]
MENLKILDGKGYDIEIQSWPIFDNLELEYVQDAVRSTSWWRMAGNQIDEFEKAFAAHHQSKNALAVTNGTHALELIFLALGIGVGDEVIIPAFTFISTATAIMRCGAIPVPVDVTSDTYCLDPNKVREAISSKTKAIVPVHMAGHACEMDGLQVICEEFNLKLIEDAAHAHGGSYKGKKLGSFGDAAIFSFQQFKLMSAGEGGIIVYQDNNLTEELFRLHNVGRPQNDSNYLHIGLGSNYRMSEFQAAVLRAQLTRLDQQTEVREKNASMLDSLLQDIPGIVPQVKAQTMTTHPHYMYMFQYDSEKFGGMTRLEFIDALVAEGIPAYRAYPTVQSTDVFKTFVNSKEVTAPIFLTPVADNIAENVVWIHHRMLLSPQESIEKLAKVIKSIYLYSNRSVTI